MASMPSTFASRRLFLLLSLLFMPLAARAVPDFTKEDGVRLSSGSPQFMFDTSSTSRRMFFVRDYVVRSATSSDQVSWVEESEIRLSSDTPTLFNRAQPINGCSALPLTAGGYRMLYSVGIGTGPFAILIATSADGIGFGAATVSTAVFISSGAHFTGSPKLVELANGDWRLYYTQAISAATPDVRAVFTALSTNEGVTWSTTSSLGGLLAGEIAIATRTDQRVRIVYTAPPVDLSTSSRTTLFSALSSNSSGNSFSGEDDSRLSTATASGSISNPLLVRSSTDSFRYRLYYNFTMAGSTVTDVYSALTALPDPQSISPVAVVNNDSSASITVLGEIFSAAPTVQFTQTGQTTINGTVTRVNDQQLTVVMNPFGAALGQWNVVVTNDDGQSQTLSSALTVTFAAGRVTLTDNLLRPRLNGQTIIDPEIFVAGDVSVKIFTMDGRLVKTLFDGFSPLGNVSVPPWDGTNDEGKTVASGVYLVQVKGPKLDTIKKIVVVR